MHFTDCPFFNYVVGYRHAGWNNTVKISAVKSNLPVTKVTPSQQQPSPVPAEASSEKPAPLGSSSKFCPQKMASTQSSVSADRFQAAHLLPRPAS